MFRHVTTRQFTLEPTFNFLPFKAYPHLMFIFNNHKSIISVLNSQFSKRSLNVVFTVHIEYRISGFEVNVKVT